MTELNQFAQTVGRSLPDWSPPDHPGHPVLAGRFCRLEALDPERHGADLFAANQHDADASQWTYLPYGPFAGYADYLAWLQRFSQGNDPVIFAIVDLATGKATGVAGYLRISPQEGSIEIGHLRYSTLLQRRPAATEAICLLMQHAFTLGYRRCEWKCDSLNAASRRAALRLGFQYEGLFRQARVTKGRNRDTAWFSVIDGEWPLLQAAFVHWLAPENFDAAGQQKISLAALRKEMAVSA